MAERPSMPAIYAALAEDGPRNNLFFDDVLKSLEVKRSPIVLTERKDPNIFSSDSRGSPRTSSCSVAACPICGQVAPTA